MFKVTIAKYLLSAVIFLSFSVSFSMSGKAVEGDEGDYKTTIKLETKAPKGTHTFKVELALDDEDRALGLMYRRTMPVDEGMLFIFKKSQQASFWMKNTVLPLDMIFIRETGRVANVLHSVPPQNLDPRRSKGRVIAVLELNAGVAQKIGLKAGDKISLPLSLLRRAK